MGWQAIGARHNGDVLQDLSQRSYSLNPAWHLKILEREVISSPSHYKSVYKVSMDNNKLDLSSLDKIKVWLEENKDLSTYDLVLLSKKSPSTIRNWRRRFGLNLGKSPFPNTNQEYKRVEVEVINDPKIWDNREWFKKKYIDEELGTPTIARIVNRSVICVVGRLKKYNILMRSHKDSVKSKSPYCNYNWLNENYNIKKLGLRKCSQIADVSSYTIYNWLVKFGFEPRSPHQAMAGSMNPFHGRKHTEETKNKIREAIRKQMQERAAKI